MLDIKTRFLLILLGVILYKGDLEKMFLFLRWWNSLNEMRKGEADTETCNFSSASKLETHGLLSFEVAVLHITLLCLLFPARTLCSALLDSSPGPWWGH